VGWSEPLNCGLPWFTVTIRSMCFFIQRNITTAVYAGRNTNRNAGRTDGKARFIEFMYVTPLNVSTFRAVGGADV
jgi:hypothetical protein